MPVTIKTVALRYRDQQGDFQEASCLKGTDATVTVVNTAATVLTIQPYPVTYDFGVKEALTVTVTTGTSYRFMFQSPQGYACNLIVNGVTNIVGDIPAAGRVSIVDVWNGIANITTLDSGSLPEDYTQMDYIVTSGMNARFDTGISGNNEKLSFEVDMAAHTFTANTPVIGNWEIDGKAAWILGPAVNDGYFWYNYFNRSYSANKSVRVITTSAVDLRILFTLSPSGLTYVRSDGETGTATATGTSAAKSTANIAIGSKCATEGGDGCVTRVFHVKIFDNGFLVRHYIPCVRNSDSVAGFFDLVGRTFNPSTGTVAFTAGNL